MLRKRMMLCLGLVAFSLVGLPVRAQEDIPPRLLSVIPETVNTLTVIRVSTLMKSPLAVREGWEKKRETDYLNGAIVIPPWSNLVVVATKLNFDNPLHSPSTAIIDVGKEWDVEDLAKRERGRVTMAGGEYVVLSSRQAYFIPYKNYMAVVTPSDRNELREWIKWAKKNKEPVLDPYLLTAVREETTAPILIAIDAQDMVDAPEMRKALGMSPVLAGKSKEEREAVAGLLAKLRGIRCTFRFEDAITAAVRFDFDVDVGAEGKYVPALVAEALDARGAQIEELAGAQVAVSGKRVTLHSKISEPALRHLLSVVSPPLPERGEPLAAPAPAPKLAPTQEELEAQATLRYFHSVQNLMKELQKKNEKAADYAKTALWHDTYAKRIAQLPVKNVDEEMIRYGAQISSYLNALADSLHGLRTYIYGLENGATFIVGQRGSFATTIPEIRMKQADAEMKGREDREKIWKQADHEETEIRRKMYDKHHLSF
jgi:hypothetical protein